MNRDKPDSRAILEFTGRFVIDVEIPDSLLAFDVQYLKLANFLFTQSREYGNQRDPEFLIRMMSGPGADRRRGD